MPTVSSSGGVGEFLAFLQERRVQLWLDGDDIRVRAADASLLASVLKELRSRKGEIVEALRRTVDEIPRLAAADDYELSHAQRRLWLLSQIDGASAAYNIPLAVRLEGDLDIDALRRALAEIVRRHESLRTAFVSSEGQPRQVIVDDAVFSLPVHDVSKDEARIRAGALAEAPFDLVRAPLLRGALLRFGAHRYELHLVVHHIIVDGWSLSVILREVSALYAAFRDNRPSPLAPLRIQYRDYAAWQNETLRCAGAGVDDSYWRAQLAAPLPLLELPADFPRPPLPSFRGELLTFTLDAARRAALLRLARDHRVTLFMLLLALVKVLLHRYTGQDDILIGTPVAGRMHADLEGQVGMYLNTLVLRDTVVPAMSFAELLGRVRQTALDAYEHQVHPFDKLVEDLGAGRDVARSPLFDVLVILQNAGALELSLPGVRVTPLESETATSKCDLTFDFADSDDELTVGIRYATDLFTRSRIQRVSAHLRELVDAVVRDVNLPIGRLEILPAAERALVVDGFNHNLAPFDGSKSVVDLFEEQAGRTPDAAAVSFEERTLTYRELRELSRRIAAHVRQATGPGVVVGLFVERSLHMLPALLGIMKAGCAYLPLDPANPQQRLGHMLRDAALALLLTDRALSGRAEELLAHAGVTPLVLRLNDVVEQAATADDVPIAPASLAYILYTSGSTGLPKGVEIEHHSLTNALLSMRERPGLAAGDTLLAVTTISFDIAGLDLYLPLIVGGHVVIASSALASDGLLLAERLRRGDITVLQATPGTWRMLLNAGWEGSKDLKILCGGEMLTRDLAAMLAARCGDLRNLYGPTEATIWATEYDVSAALADSSTTTTIPVGRPLHNLAVYVVDDRLQPVPLGVRGEVCIAGAGVARGYRNLPELTAERFVPNPFGEGKLYRTGDAGRFRDDGTLEILGRLDQQVKVRGFRVELGEVECALRHCEGVRDALVSVHCDERGEAALVGYVIPRDLAPDPARLRHELALRLPGYMIPSDFVPIHAWPLAPSGKIDRAALPPPESLVLPAGGKPPRDDVECTVAAVWSEVLERPSLSIDDNFFDLGGHSLKGTRALFRLQRALRVPLALIDLFRHPTVAAFAALIRSRVGDPQ